MPPIATPPHPLRDVRALVFDVFGTLVDWRTSIARQAKQALAPLGIEADWLAFADAWRAQYQPAMARVREGALPYRKLDDLHRLNLDAVLTAWGLAHRVDEATREHLNRAWHRLDAWPDVAAGLHALRPRVLLAPCSNGHIALMVHLARHNGWVWDAILGAELARDYKPKPGVYRAAVEALDLPPQAVMMVAAHSDDLAAAAQVGLRTAFVARPDEHGPGRGERRAAVPVDVEVSSLPELAERLGPADSP
ncbi:(S)-2-haloacid dehalogenase 4A [Tepidimonas fonticaldi]|uniref:(S)-2-haloacid dehalogenase 4A n=1 Tax=Tepidimonas fonticaldi TaxID=1101373 RepID=A0A1A6DTV1_9BURK|nr:haloacid dehalogenase type II [Tepidimonas fonticaldi]OBS30106.1 haloacid dehalogenase, type II [Tepidimonas fonticaldi]TSE33250.1 (S)-2-haloacid dehalogenase 4A [Tepidimonas fonticaldi]